MYQIWMSFASLQVVKDAPEVAGLYRQILLQHPRDRESVQNIYANCGGCAIKICRCMPGEALKQDS
jgi:hypothetical protein